MAETLPTIEWLHLAKRVPLGRSDRTYHGRENRPNLVVYNNESEWSAQTMACPKCGCKTVYQFDDEDEPQDDRLQRCAACGEVFDLDDHAEEDDDD